MPLADLYRNTRETIVFVGQAVSRVDTAASSTITISVPSATGDQHTSGSFTTTSAVAATAATVAIPTGQIVRIQASWSALDATTGDRLMRETVAFYKNVAGTVTQVGSDSDTINHEDDATWAATLAISGTDVLVRYQGDTTNSVSWRVAVWTYTPGN